MLVSVKGMGILSVASYLRIIIASIAVQMTFAVLHTDNEYSSFYIVKNASSSLVNQSN